MSQTTKIIRRRYLRESKKSRGRQLAAKAVIVAFLFVALSAGGLVLLTLGSVAGIYNYFTSGLPDFSEIEKLGEDTDTTFETTKIFAWGKDDDLDGTRDLELIYEVIDPLGGDREWLTLDEIPLAVVDATVAIEDKSFWTNQGYDLEGIGRAFYAYVLEGGQIQGGSSITQQLVKNTLIEEERRIVGEEVGYDDYRRKVEELLLAHRISQVYSKEQIIEWYLNANFYGNLAYGIEAASRVYFDKTAAQLNLAEAAMLAAIPQSPALNPIDNPDLAKNRQELVLDSMFREGMIDRDAMNAAKAAPIEVSPGIEERYDIIAPHFAIYVRKQLEEMFGPEKVLRGGLRVYTTLDLTMQEQAECVARAQVDRLSGEGSVGNRWFIQCCRRRTPSAGIGLQAFYIPDSAQSRLYGRHHGLRRRDRFWNGLQWGRLCTPKLRPSISRSDACERSAWQQLQRPCCGSDELGGRRQSHKNRAHFGNHQPR
jgi:membrane peptidoglycan carboxypeptidase